MNPLNTQQHQPTAAQYYITEMPPLTSATSVLKSNISATVSTMTQQQPTIVSTLNSLENAPKDSAANNGLLDTSKYVTTATNYMPVLLTNQTLISNVGPVKQQQQQNSSKIAPQGMLGLASLGSGTSTSNPNIPLISGNCNKPMVLNTASNVGNITYQVLSTSQNNKLTPVITTPNGTVGVLLSSTQSMKAAGHVAEPIFIRNTPSTAAVRSRAVRIKQQLQLTARRRQQQNQKSQQQKIILNTFNPQSLNAEILKQMVVGNIGTGTAQVVTPGATLLKPTILQNKPMIQQQQIQNKTIVKNAKVMITTPQQQLPQKQNNCTIITTSSENSSQMFAALDMELGTAPIVAQNVQKLPQVSLLQTTAKPSNITQDISEPEKMLKNSLEIKVGNLNSEVSVIKKPNISSADTKSKESSLLKTSNKIQAETLENHKQDLEKANTINTKKNDNKEMLTKIELKESFSLLKSNQDLKKFTADGNNVASKVSSTQVEKQTSLLKPKTSIKKATEISTTVSESPQLTSPRSQRSNSYNSFHGSSDVASTTNNERRHSEPAKIDLVAKSSIEDNEAQQEAEILKSQELAMFFEEEEYLESSGDKLSIGSEKSHDNDNKIQRICIDAIKEMVENPASATNELKISSKIKPIEIKQPTMSDENYKEMSKNLQEKEYVEGCEEVNSSQDVNDRGTTSEDDDVTILPAEEVEIEQIEIDDDDDEKVIPQTNLRPTTEGKEDQLNESLLCNEQVLISSSSSISNNSLDQNSTPSSLKKSPQVGNSVTPWLKKTLIEPKIANQKEEPQSNGYSSVLDMLSNFNMLSWRERIGTARGTNLKFQLNEFNLIQIYEKSVSTKRIHTAYEKPIYERESSHKRNENNEPPTYYTCRRCNVQGPSVDFLAPEFCSFSCLKRDCRKRRDDTFNSSRKRNRLYNINNNTNHLYNNGCNVNESFSYNNPPPLTYIRKPKFRWNTYMNRNYNVIAAPISLFLNPFPTGPNNFIVGMKLEAIDPENCALFCVCTVVCIMGYRLKLSFDGYSNAYDFWINADSMDIFPPGWCAKTNRILQPPKGTTANKFNWGAYLNKEKALPAPRYLFTHLNSSSLTPHNPFKVGMHLEAEDLNDTGKLCVASVADVLDDRIRIHFDGWDDCYDIIVDINSPYIHPCGWHEGRQQLVVPPDCENTAFNWNDYIRKQGTGEAASEELFAPREPIGFKPNMRLEVVDPRNPSLIRPATVVSHKGHRVKLHLDGWPSDYCFWLEDDSPDLHPIGWCDATGHDLEPPPGFQISKQKMPCPVDGCRGIGNAKNSLKCFHATREGCPYAAENWRTVIEKPQRINYEDIVRTVPKQAKHPLAQQVASLQSRLSEQQILERLQMLDNIKTRNVLVQQDKLLTNHSDLVGGFSIPHLKDEEINKVNLSRTCSSGSISPKTTYAQQQHDSDNTLDVNLDIAREYLYDYGPRLQQNFSLWQKNFSFDAEKIKCNPIEWSTTEVSVFVDLYLNCRKTAALFNHEDIDGEAFLLLQQQDLTGNFGMKLGPAVKLYNCILQLRTLAVTKFEVPYKRLTIKK